MKFFLTILFFVFIATESKAESTVHHNYTGYEISQKFKTLQNFIVDYEVENGGPILDNKVGIYKISKGKCVIVAKIDGDSGGFGSEDILYFYNSKFLSGYTLAYSYTFLNSEGTKKSKKPNYMDITNDKENTVFLKADFIKYLKKFNKNTLSNCN